MTSRSEKSDRFGSRCSLLFSSSAAFSLMRSMQSLFWRILFVSVLFDSSISSPQCKIFESGNKSGNKKSISCNKTKNATLQKPKKFLLFKLYRLHFSLPKNVAVNRRPRQSEYSDFNGNGSCDGFSPNFPLILYPAVKYASVCAESVLLRWVTVKKKILCRIFCSLWLYQRHR